MFDQGDPHKKDGRTIPGRSERIEDQINPRYYLSNNKSHTTYISKLVTRICDAGKSGRGSTARYSVIDRLSAIYDLVIIDEAQDLVGWDFIVLERMLTPQGPDLYCVGDFRQSIYQTSHAKRAEASVVSRQRLRMHKSQSQLALHSRNLLIL